MLRSDDSWYVRSLATDMLLEFEAQRALALDQCFKKLLVTKGIATRSKDATKGSWPYY